MNWKPFSPHTKNPSFKGFFFVTDVTIYLLLFFFFAVTFFTVFLLAAFFLPAAFLGAFFLAAFLAIVILGKEITMDQIIDHVERMCEACHAAEDRNCDVVVLSKKIRNARLRIFHQRF